MGTLKTRCVIIGGGDCSVDILKNNINYINNIIAAPYFMSEAINENKSRYYKAIVETRNTNNDLTCFLGYIIETAIEYCYVYKNMEEIIDCFSSNYNYYCWNWCGINFWTNGW